MKIFEIKTSDWEKALSVETENFVGGIFKVFTNCDPFYRNGNFQPTLAPVEIGSGTISSSLQIRAIMPYYSSGNSKFYALANDYKLYDINPATPTVTDVSAQIFSGTGSAHVLAQFKGRLIYIVDDKVRSNIIPVSSGSDVSILTGLTGGSYTFTRGADGYGYIGNGNNVAKIVSESTTTNNTTTVAVSLETGYVVRKLVNDGRYLVWIADNNTGAKGSCVVAFWDMAKSVFDQIYEFQDYGIAGAELISGAIKIITKSGIYVCNFSTPPRMVFPFGGTVTSSDIPYNSYAGCTTVYKNNILSWVNTTGKIFGYGTNINGKADKLFQLNKIASASAVDSMGTDNTYIVVGAVVSGSVKMYLIGSGSTYNTSVANVAGFALPQPYTFAYAKVVLRSPMSSGNSVSIKLLSGGSTKTIKASETRTYSTDPNEQNLIFYHTSAGDGSDVQRFIEITDIELTSNVAIKTLEIHGDPTDEKSTIQ